MFARCLGIARSTIRLPSSVSLTSVPEHPMNEPEIVPPTVPPTMRAVRVHSPGGVEGLQTEELEVATPGPGEALVRVHAAAITRDELGWPVDRLPAIPSYEVSGVVVGVGPGVGSARAGEPVYALTPFDRAGGAAEYVVVPAGLLASKPRSLTHAEAAAVPMGGLSAWQGLFVHGRLEAGQRVLIHGAAGGVGHIATQLARWRGARVIGTATGAGVDAAKRFGAHDVVDRSTTLFEDVVEPVDLVFDTVGGAPLARSGSVLRAGGTVVSVAEEPPEGVGGVYFVVEPDGAQLSELTGIIDEGSLRPEIDGVFPLTEARAAFERVMSPGKRGKVVLEVLA
jgi:NADPH:quinone reductase-like Zn-dependent oxidoreductase